MQTVHGDVWLLSKPLDSIVIPTNIGWRKDGTAVLGRGLAAQASARYPDLSAWYGAELQGLRENAGLSYYRPKAHDSRNLILFPTKPLNKASPNMSWSAPSDLELIHRGLLQLKDCLEQSMLPPACRLFLPALGCGCGGLKQADVVPMITELLGRFDNVRLVLRNIKRTGGHVAISKPD